MCCKKNAKGKLYITEKTIKNTADLVQAIQKRLGIDDDHVIRHFDVNGKLCPYPYIEASKWKVLHAKLTGSIRRSRQRELDREKVFPADIKADWTSHKGEIL